MYITDLLPDNKQAVEQVATLLVEGFKDHWPDAWPDMHAALTEVEKSFQEGCISRVARVEDGSVVGWVGGIRQYNGHVWELHPLVVHANYRGQGIGRTLVRDLEFCVRQRGGLTLWLGTDDEHNQTTLSGVDLYPDVCAHIARVQNLSRHPYEFYLKLGFVIVGIMPDANGLGKPDIYMAKRVQ
jgi:aminoglycoside 6'-N-acetyltransferase I